MLLREQGKSVALYLIGRKAVNYYTFRARPVEQSWTGFSEQPYYRDAAAAGTLTAGTGTETALRAFERARSGKVSVVSRQAGSEDYNRYGAALSRLAPSRLATAYYTRWLRQISTYLDPAA